MIAELRLENFRCFRDHRIPFRGKTIVVGKNNAGKSSVIEALRLVSVIADRSRAVSYSPPPRWLELHMSNRGIAPSLDNQAFNFERVFHRHGDPPAIVNARFVSGATITVYIGSDNRIHGVVRNASGHIAGSKSEALRMGIPTVAVLPQIGPVRPTERVIDEQRVRQNLSSSLSSLHFRNQLHVLKDDYYYQFKEIAEDTWHGLKIEEIEKYRVKNEEFLTLMIRNEDFAADVSWMGHGLQMWLQTMWFLARSKEASTIVLDEPDVYMHSDLQRKLIRFVRNRHPQVIIATHSVEIIAEVGPDDVLVIDRDKREARFAADSPEVQAIISHMGGIHNLQLARMATAKKCIFIEGDDLELLRKLQNHAFPESEHPIDLLPHLSIGGWGGWSYVIGSTMWVESTIPGVSKFCLLDSDYHTSKQISDRMEEAKRKSVRLKIWRRKEIENYFLIPSAIARLLNKLSRGKPQITADMVQDQMDVIAESMRQSVEDGLADEIQKERRNLATSTANAEARQYVKKHWATFEGRMSVVRGKSMLAQLNTWARDKFKISFGTDRLADEIRKSEIDPEVLEFLSAVEFDEELES